MKSTSEIGKCVMIITKCVKGIGSKDLEKGYAEFSFKGYYLGQRIIKVLLAPNKKEKFVEGESYLIWMGVLSSSKGVLKGNVLKMKRIDDD